MNRKAPMEERFWANVDKRGPDECWEWTAGVNPDGYAVLRRPNSGGPVRAHRYSAMLHFGMFDRRLFVCHRCDNRKCVNPNHLYLGTHADNMRDVRERKRIARGRMTHCARGHEFTEANTRMSTRSRRACRACHRIFMSAYRARKRAQREQVAA